MFACSQIDKDVRIQALAYRGRVDDPVTYFDSVARRTYGDIIATHYRIDVLAGASLAIIRAQISRLGLHPNVEWTALDFPLWLPDDSTYFPPRFWFEMNQRHPAHRCCFDGFDP